MKAKMVSGADVLKAISDNGSIELFRTVALTRPDTDTIISKTKLTRKQYYSRMSSLTKAGLIKRKSGKHTLTAFGKVIYYTTLIPIENAISYYWKLKAIDSLAMSKDHPAEELEKVIDNLIENHEIKAVLVSANKVENQTYASIAQQKQTHQLKPELLVH